MFFPVVVLVAILPGLYALRNWDLNPPGPWWGLRGLAVADGRILDQIGMPGIPPGHEAWSYRAVALQTSVVCLARSVRPLGQPRPGPVLDHPAQLRGGGSGGPPGVRPGEAVARSGGGADRGRPDRVQPRAPHADAAGHARHARAGRGSGISLRLCALPESQRGEAAALGGVQRVVPGGVAPGGGGSGLGGHPHDLPAPRGDVPPPRPARGGGSGGVAGGASTRPWPAGSSPSPSRWLWPVRGT